MKIEKNGNVYIVKETPTTWTLARQIGSIPVKYTVKKLDCPTLDALKDFVNENNAF